MPATYVSITVNEMCLLHPTAFRVGKKAQVSKCAAIGNSPAASERESVAVTNWFAPGANHRAVERNFIEHERALGVLGP